MLCFSLGDADSAHSKTESDHEIYFKEEPVDDAVACTKADQYELIKKDESIDIKYEPLLSGDEHDTFMLVSYFLVHYSSCSEMDRLPPNYTANHDQF